MIQWICTGLIILLLTVLRFRTRLDILLHIIEKFFWASAVNALFCEFGLYDPGLGIDIQGWIDTICIGLLLMQILTGAWDIQYKNRLWCFGFGGSVLGIMFLKFIVLGFMHGILKMEVPFEVTHTITFTGLFFILWVRFMYVRKAFWRDYRFGLIFGTMVYYFWATLAYYGNWGMIDTPQDQIFHLHEFGFITTTICFLISFFLWQKTQGKGIPNQEWYLLPNAAMKRLYFTFKIYSSHIMAWVKNGKA
ncbi:MAG TPA: hypothetical protein VEC36_00275 [Patescibacteria group bacterium]|nr:hypothetical protein [Patescibacteria group bacterium]